MSEKRPPPESLGVIATTGPQADITEWFIGAIRPMRDAVLAAKGAGLELYEDVRRDDRVMTGMQQRRLALLARPWTVEPGAQDAASVAAADALRADLGALGWDGVCEKMHWGLFWGYAVGEVVWQPRTDTHGTRWTFGAIKVRKARRFRFGADGTLRLLTQAAQQDGEPMPDKKFWTFTSGEDADDYPYGIGLAHWLYWPVYFKRHALRMWAQAVEKFAEPTAIGSYPQNATADDQKRLLQALRAVHRDSGVVVPEGVEIKLLEAVKAAGADQSLLYAAMDRAIATIITGQSTTIEAASNRSQTDTHKDVRDELIQADGDLLIESFRAGPLAWWMEYNFPGAAMPVLARSLQDEEDLEALARIDETLDRLGYGLTEDAVRETYGDRYRRKAGDGVGAGRVTATAFSETRARSPDAVEALTASLAEAARQKGPAAILAEVTAALDAAPDLAGFGERLTELALAEPDLDGFVDLLAGATLQARVAGASGLELD